jgi:disulfide bond formation protein DsbB
MQFSEIFTAILSWGTLAAHVGILFFIVVLSVRNRMADKLITWIGQRAVALSFLVVLGGVVGSLVYSEVVGFEACTLCFWQRMFLFPQLVLFGLAFWWKDKSVLPYAFALSIIGGVIALYHAVSNLTGFSALACTAEGALCSKLYVLAFGYITIPTMSLTIFVILGMLFFFSRKTRRFTSLM